MEQINTRSRSITESILIVLLILTIVAIIGILLVDAIEAVVFSRVDHRANPADPNIVEPPGAQPVPMPKPEADWRAVTPVAWGPA